MPRLKKSTKKRRATKLIKAYQKNGCNQHRTAEALGISQPAVHQKLHTPIVQQTFQEVMEKAGITNEKLAQKLDEGLDAVKVIGYLHQYKQDKDGNLSKASPEETVSNEFIDTPDMPTRHKYLTTALTILGHLKEKIEHSFDLTPEQRESILDRLRPK